MIQATCYKCHKTFTEDLHHKLIVPAGTLTLKNPKGKLVGKEVVVDEIDLCPECREKLWDWLHNKEDATPEE